MKKRLGKKKNRITSTLTTATAAEISSNVGATRAGRDSLTRVTSPIKGVDTRSRQWSRWAP